MTAVGTAFWERLAAGVAALDPEDVVPPSGGRIGAVLVLLREVPGDVEIVYTRRRDDLRAHPGQISFPGGRVDPGETIEDAAVREAHEEVGLDPASVTLLGRLPPFYIPPSRFWLQGVLARWDAPHPLVAAEDEVAEVLSVRLSLLHDRAAWRAVQLSVSGWSWAWDLGGGHLLWGATGFLTAVLLELLDPAWSGGVSPQDLPAERRVRPWEWSGQTRQVPVGGPPLVHGAPERPRDELPAGSGVVPGPDPSACAVAGEAVAEAVARLRGRRGAGGSVAVLAGPGWTGVVGLQAAAALTARGHEVDLILAGADGRWVRNAAGARVTVFEGGPLPDATVVVDALVGRGLEGPLRGRPLELAHLLRTALPTVVAVDLPSGIDPERGLIGELLPADLTVALVTPLPGLFHPGLGPFVGDLYVAPLTGPDPLLRITGR